MADPFLMAGGALSTIGSMASSAINVNQARVQRDFEERMSNTAYQRAVKDMEKAGLNTALMYGHGGAASTPAVAPARVDNPAEGISSAFRAQALDVARVANETRSTDAAVSKAESEVELNRLVGALRVAETGVSNKTLDEIVAKIDSLKTQADLNRANARSVRAGIPVKETFGGVAKDANTILNKLRSAASSGDWSEFSLKDWGRSYNVDKQVLDAIKGSWRSVSDWFSSGKGNASGGANSAKAYNRRSRMQ